MINTGRRKELTACQICGAKHGVTKLRIGNYDRSLCQDCRLKVVQLAEEKHISRSNALHVVLGI